MRRTSPHLFESMSYTLIIVKNKIQEITFSPETRTARHPPSNSPYRAVRASASPALPEYLEGRTPKEKHPFLFQKKIHPRQIRNARSVFLSGLLAYSLVRGAFSKRTIQFCFTTHAERATSFVLEIGASLVQQRHTKAPSYPLFHSLKQGFSAVPKLDFL